MSTSAIDYSFQKPTVAQLQAAGITDVFRYVGPAAWGKTITQVEFDAHHTAGIRDWLVFEQGVNDSAGGFAAGVANARLALANAPAGYVGPFFFACDEDLVGPALATAVEYIHGASSVVGPDRTGDYGPGALCQATHDAGFAALHWQSASTSFNDNAKTLPITQVQQGLGGPLPGTDADSIVLPLIAPAGPPPGPALPPSPPADTDQMETLMTLAASKQDALNAQIRDWWATYRSDPLSTPAVQYLAAGYNGPWGGSIDAVLACIIDSATTQGHLRPEFAGAA